MMPWLLLATLFGPADAGWLRDYDQARALARLTGRPLLVVFRCEH